MGYVYGTNHFYGVHVPREQYAGTHLYDETDRLDKLIKGASDFPAGLRHVTAGEYDQYELFLAFVPADERIEVPLGEWRLTNYTIRVWDLPEWDRLLSELVSEAGYENLGDPGWVTVPYCD